jgi:hypothetical protein
MLTNNQLKDLLVKPKNGPANHFIAECPFCYKPDHFYINKGYNNKGILHPYDCKKCGVSGSVFTFLAKLNALHLIEGRQQENDELPKLSFGQAKEEEIEEVVLPNKSLPIGSRLIIEGSPEYKYLQTRKFKEIEFLLYQPQYTKLMSKLANYVIIPIYQDFSIKGYVSRYGIDKKDPRYDKDKLRYINSKNTDFSCLLGGIDEINNKTTSAILVEGFFDKVSVTTELNLHYVDELKSLCTFGKKISAQQIKLIKKTNIKTIILMYDQRDAVNDMKKISFELLKDFNVLIAETGGNDPGDTNKSEFLSILDNLKSPYGFWSEIQKKTFK